MRRLLRSRLTGAAAWLAALASSVALGGSTDLAGLPLEELMNVEVVSASRKAESYAGVAAAVFVLTGEDLRRLGVTTIPDALRVVPGLQVAQIDANTWAVSARGSNGQFANKLLVMIDGRSLYSPSYSGVLWDLRDLPVDEIERIEIIRGPGGAVWGANAVNGVINVITRPASSDPGGLARLGVGSQSRPVAGVRWAGRAGPRSYLRAFATTRREDGFPVVEGNDGDDRWRLSRAGFRFDLSTAADGRVTVDGDVFGGKGGETVNGRGIPPEARTSRQSPFSGGHVRGRWETGGADRGLAAQVFVDRFRRDLSLVTEHRTTWDLEGQARVRLGRHDLQTGVSFRRSDDRFDATDGARMFPDAATLDWLAAFVQDEMALASLRSRVTLGVKAERNDYTGWEVQPTARWAVRPSRNQTLWAALSAAVRTPSRAARGLEAESILFAGPPLRIMGSSELRSERLRGYEAGYRLARDRWSVDLAAFHHRYRDLEIVRPDLAHPIIEPIDEPPFFRVVIPASFGNGGRGHAQGAELALDLRPRDRWRVLATGSWLHARISSPEGSLLRDDPKSNPERQFSVTSFHDMGRWQLDATLRRVSALAGAGSGDVFALPGVPSYTTADLRIGYRAGPRLDLSLAGRNLARSRQLEFVPEGYWTPRSEVERSVFLQATIRF